jgi:LPPG:FO 2-phospho-L-lactate transferase
VSPRVALLAGGVGGAKLADGLYRALPHGDLSIIANPGDDFELHGLTICPDHDTLLYTLAGLGDRERGWGLAGESWNALDQFGKIGAPDWFKLGDRDLALHIHRTALLKAGGRLTEVNRELQRRLGLADAPILMATDDPLRTRLRTPEGWMEFQPWFVGAQAKPEVLEVEFLGAQSTRMSSEVAEALRDADLIAIAPSNPLISIAPILAVGGVQEATMIQCTGTFRCLKVTPRYLRRSAHGQRPKTIARQRKTGRGAVCHTAGMGFNNRDLTNS